MTEEEKEDWRGARLVSFWARKQEIEEMLEARHTVKNIHRRLGKEMNISYEQLSRYVRQHIRSKPNVSNHDQANETTVPRKTGRVPFKRNDRDDLVS